MVSKYDLFIGLISFLHTGFLILGLIMIYLTIKGKKDTPLDIKIRSVRTNIEFIFILLMSILLIILFNPIHNSSGTFVLDKNVQRLLFVFGIILMVTAKWKDFFKNIRPKKITNYSEIETFLDSVTLM